MYVINEKIENLILFNNLEPTPKFDRIIANCYFNYDSVRNKRWVVERENKLLMS
jgi:hypothetical protein